MPVVARPLRAFGLWLALAALGVPLSAEAGFRYRKPLTIQGARVTAAPHTDFPVLVSLVDPNLRTLANGGRVVSASGHDLAFMLQGTGAALDHEIESYDGSTGTLVAWVRMPTLAAADTTVLLYYGDPEVGCAPNPSGSVWDAGHVGVWHLAEAVTDEANGAVHRDSTANGRNGTQSGNVHVAGRIARGQDFDGDDFVNLGTAFPGLGSTFTIEGWVWFDDFTSEPVLFAREEFTQLDYRVVYDNNCPLRLRADISYDGTEPGDADSCVGAAVSSGRWHHFAAVKTATDLTMYLDGVAGTPTATSGTVNHNPGLETRMARRMEGAQPLDGRLDEVRVSSIARSAGWIRTTFDNADCPSTSTCGVPANRFVVEGAEQAVPTRYRSIGDTTTPYSAGTVSATSGSTTVTGTLTAWRTANRGRGDTVTFGGFTGTVLSVDSETQLRLTSPSTVTGSGLAYSINRKFADLASWENCIDGGGTPCGPDPAVASSSLVADDRVEVGVAYKDKVYVDTVAPLGDDVVRINDSTTGPFHTITLTADPGNRHNGVAGAGVTVDLSAAAAECQAIEIADDYVTVEWMEVRNGATSADGIAIASGSTGAARVRHNLVHAIGDRGIQVHGPNHAAEISSNVVYDVGRGIRVEEGQSATTSVRILNNTVFGSTSLSAPGISGAAPLGGTPVTVSNNISHSNASGDFGVPGLNAASRNNLSGDATAVAHSPGGGGLDSVPLAGAGGVNFVATTPGSEDFHLRTTAPLSAARDAGADLTCFLRRDIDGLMRLAPWEIGADDVNPLTEVSLVSFTAHGTRAGIELRWETASELHNMGFHLQRAASAEGPYERLTASLIPGLGSSPTGASYSYEDSGLEAGTRWFYRLEDVETSGRTTSHGPVSAVAGSSDCACDPEPGADPVEADPPARIRVGTPEASRLEVVERSRTHVLLELVTEGFVLVRAADGTVRLEVPGFEAARVPGAPDVPVRLALVEAVAGRGVRMSSVRPSGVRSFAGLKVGAAGAPELREGPGGVVLAGRSRRPLEARHRRGGAYPRSWARLVDTVFQGVTKKARVELAPLRHDPASGTTVLARRLQVRLDFAGVDHGETPRGGALGLRRVATRPSRSGGVVARLVTAQAGLYRVRFEDAFGSSGRPVPVSRVRLSRQGESVAFRVEPAREPFGPGSVLYFVGGGDLNSSGETVYELEVGRSGLAMETVDGRPSGEVVGEYLRTVRREENRTYQAGLVDATDLWLWDILVAPASKSFGFEVGGLAATSTPGRVHVVLQGASDLEPVDDHHVKVGINGIPLAEARWDGRLAEVIDASVPPGVLREGKNTLELENVGDTEAARSMVFLNRFEVSYPRVLVAEEGQMEGVFALAGAAAVAGLRGDAHVVDVTGVPAWVAGATRTPGGIAFRAEAERRYVVVEAGAELSPLVRRPAPSRLASASNAAEWLLVAPRELLPAARPLVELRRSQGLAAEAVELEHVFEEFGHGEPSAGALRRFLEHAYQSWAAPPLRYVVLLGDATYDPKDYLKTGVLDRVPTPILRTSYLWTASDPTLAAVNGEDLLPDLAVGRLPARDLAEAEHLVEKLVAFETSSRGLRGPAALVADDADAGGNFEANADEIAASLLAGREVKKIYLRDGGPAETRLGIAAALEDGLGILSYVGHGGTAVWAGENVWNSWDVPSLPPQDRQPLLLTLSCLNGFFHLPSIDSLAEAFVKAEGRGAIAAVSPSGLSLDGAAHEFHRALLSEIESGRHDRLGDAVLAAQSAYADRGLMPELLSVYHLFGDPALAIR